MGRHEPRAGRRGRRTRERGAIDTRTPAVVVAIVLVAFAVGVVVGRGDRATPSAAVVTTPSPSPTVGPTHVVNGVPQGFSHDRSGAVAAATSYAEVLAGPLAADPEQYNAAVAAMAAPDARDTLAQSAASELTVLESTYHLISTAARGIKVAVRGVPLAYHVDSAADTHAVVSIWLAGLLAEDGVQPPLVSWATGTYTMEWVNDDWKLGAIANAAGPVPGETQAGAPSAALPVQLRDYTAYSSDAPPIP